MLLFFGTKLFGHNRKKLSGYNIKEKNVLGIYKIIRNKD